MKEFINQSQLNNTNYAVIDLGSNSFHLLIVQLSNNHIQIVNKVKRKVRLASGLNNQNKLSSQAISNGLDCLHFFSQYLNKIPTKNISIVATATLRLAVNRDDFLLPADKILPKNITLLSGIQEAETIYLGATASLEKQNSNQCQQLIIDIGGASTELIIGKGSCAKKAISLNLGCVSFKQEYFANNLLNDSNFTAATQAACKIIEPIAKEFKNLGWEAVFSGSGTMQALAEILSFQNKPIVINADFLLEIQKKLIKYKTISAIRFNGLREDRIPVLASGLSILTALFNCLDIQQIELSKGALREGLLFKMLINNLNSI